MAENSKIEWTDHTFNPWEGCQKVGPGCDNCYAEARDQRFTGGTHWGPGAPRRRTSAANWAKPLKWNREARDNTLRGLSRPRVFCASLADVFDNAVDPQWRADLFDLIRKTPNLDWLLLTKRPGNIAKMLPADWVHGWPNVWLGCTIVNQQEADRDIPKLLAVPAKLRFLSMEPLLGPVDLDFNFMPQEMLHWIIVGGESGPNARPMHPDWARSLRDQCAAAGVAFHFKQWGEWQSITQIPDGDDLYFPAPEEHPDASRTCRYQSICLDHAGKEYPTGQSGRFHTMPDGAFSTPGAMSMFRVGKTRAGRLLDGRTHDQFPGEL